MPVGLPLPPQLFEISIGLALGDLHIYRTKTQNASFHFEQSIKNKEYLFHLFNLFKDYCKSEPTIRNRLDKVSGNPYSSIRFTTRQLSCFTQIHNIFYLNGIKIVPSNIEKYLTPVGLAYWAMDDGSKAGSGFYFNTHSYTLEEQELLKSILFSKFGLLCNIHKHKNQYKLYIIASSITKFRTLVIPYFQDSIMYKLK